MSIVAETDVVQIILIVVVCLALPWVICDGGRYLARRRHHRKRRGADPATAGQTQEAVNAAYIACLMDAARRWGITDANGHLDEARARQILEFGNERSIQPEMAAIDEFLEDMRHQMEDMRYQMEDGRRKAGAAGDD